MKHSKNTQRGDSNKGRSVSIQRNQEFRIDGDGKATTVGLPRQIELNGLKAMFDIKPWTNRQERSYLNADVQAAKSSLRDVN